MILLFYVCLAIWFSCGIAVYVLSIWGRKYLADPAGSYLFLWFNPRQALRRASYVPEGRKLHRTLIILYLGSFAGAFATILLALTFDQVSQEWFGFFGKLRGMFPPADAKP